jgi:transposase
VFPAGLLPHLDELDVEDVIPGEQGITLGVTARELCAACPRCTYLSDRVHSGYRRTLHDLPVGPNNLALHVRVRRFRCTNRNCPQRIFAERFPGLGKVRARRTHGQQAALEEFGLALGGSAGSRLAKRMKLPASRSTILRLVSRGSEPTALTPTPRVLGVDDWARLRGQQYGTILVDLERHRPIDLLPDRTAETLARWLKEHPGVEIITRDRAGAYAEGAREGAPNAVQVADRFHLLMNVGDALERVLARKHACLKEAAAAVDRLAATEGADPGQVIPTDTAPAPASSTLTPELSTRQGQVKQARRARRLERYEEAVGLYQQGLSLREIGRQLGISRKTVKRFVRAGQFPERAERPRHSPLLGPYEAYLRERWTAGCHNARTLWEEIRSQGFAGSAPLVRQFVARWRATPGRRGKTPRRAITELTTPTPPVGQPTRVLSPRQAKWLLLGEVDELRPDKRLYREQLLQADEELRGALYLTEEFGRIVRTRARADLGPWLERAEGGTLGEFKQFALVLKRDLPAVEAALIYEWSNGQTEGFVNKLKLLKRQMFGRASLRLLQRRFLQPDCRASP